MNGCEYILLGDVRPGSSARIVSVLAMAFEHGRIAWAKRIFMTPVDHEVIALQSAARRN
jgi:TolB-like protein